MEIIIILSHLMNREGFLDNESRHRIEKGAEICINRNCAYIVTSGWDYREDCNLAIGEAAAKFLIRNFKLGNSKVLFDTNSRDTVGDAFFLRKKLSKINYSKLTIITSDYHVQRVKKIFTKFFFQTEIEIVGINTKHKICKNVLKKEKRSLSIFLNMFKNTDFKKDLEVYNLLREHHPYYNGKIYKKI